MESVQRYTVLNPVPHAPGDVGMVMVPATDFEALEQTTIELRKQLEPMTVRELLEHAAVKSLSARQINDVLAGLNIKLRETQAELSRLKIGAKQAVKCWSAAETGQMSAAMDTCMPALRDMLNAGEQNTQKEPANAEATD